MKNSVTRSLFMALVLALSAAISVPAWATGKAEAVRRWLVEHGIEAGRITARGFGPARPIESNSSEAGRARNRRVEFLILPATL